MHAIIFPRVLALTLVAWTCAGAFAAGPVVHRPILDSAGVVHRVQACADPACMDVYSACLATLKPGDDDAECLKKTMQCQEACAKKLQRSDSNFGSKSAASTAQDRENCFGKHADNDRRIRGCSQIIERGGDDRYVAGAYTARGVAYRKKGQLGIAISNYDQAIKLNPEAPGIYSSRGYAYRLQGQLDKAISDYNQAIKLDPKDPRVYYARGYAYSKKGDVDKASADYMQARKLDPKYNKGTRGAEKKQPARRVQQRTAASEGATSKDSDCLKKSGEASIRACTRIIETKRFNGKPADPAVLGASYSNRGSEYRELKQYDRAISDFRKGLSLAPNNKTIRGNLAKAYAAIAYDHYQSKRYDRAISSYDEALKFASQGQRKAGLLSNRGAAYEGNKQYRKAIADYRVAVKLDPDLTGTKKRLAALERRASSTKPIVRTGTSRATRTNSIRPNNADCWFGAGEPAIRACEAIHSGDAEVTTSEKLGLANAAGAYHLAMLGKLKLAKAHCDLAEILASGPWPLVCRGLILEMEGKRKQAMSKYEQAKKLHSDFYVARVAQDGIYRVMRRKPSAFAGCWFLLGRQRVSACSRLIKSSDSRKSFAYAYRGLGFMQQGRLESAEADCKRAHAMKRSSYSYRCLADLYERKGKKAEALKVYLAAYNADPSSIYVINQLATLGVKKPYISPEYDDCDSIFDIDC